MGARDTALNAAFALLSPLSGEGVSVMRDATLPQPIPPAGLIVMRDGDPGEPDILLNPRSEYYQHRTELEIFILADGRSESDIYALCDRIAQLIARDRGLSGAANYCYLEAPEIDRLDAEGSPRIIIAIMQMVIEYLVSDPLAA